MDERYFDCGECGRIVTVNADAAPGQLVLCPDGHRYETTDPGWGDRQVQKALENLTKVFDERNQ